MSGWTDWIGTPRHLAQRLTFATAAGVFLGLLGPFGSYDTPAASRILSWTVSFWAGVLLLGVALRAADRWAARAGAPPWFAMAAAAVLSSVPLAAFTAAAFRALRPSIVLPSPAEFYLQTLAITVPSALGYVALARRLARPAADPPPDAPSAPRPPDGVVASPFLDRLPRSLGRELHALQMEDHYVRAHTARGSALILLPLARAVEELAGVEGLRVHRSWWVARAAVQAVEEDGRNLRLRLAGGLRAPVSRSAVAELRAAGWLAGLRPNDSPDSEG